MASCTSCGRLAGTRHTSFCPFANDLLRRAAEAEVAKAASAETPQTNRAEQPARCKSVHDCAAWLATLSPQEIAAQPPLQRLSTTLKCLQASPSRQRRADIQRMAKDWGVVQKNIGVKHKSHEVEKELEAKVLHEATRLRKLQLRGSSGASSSRWTALRQALADSLNLWGSICHGKAMIGL